MYTADDLQKMYENKKARQEWFKYDNLDIQQKDIVAKVQAMLVAVNHHELMATMCYLTPPDNQNAVLIIQCAVSVGPDKDYRIFYVGKFGKCPVAVTQIQQGSGKNVVYHATKDRFKNLVLIAAVGVAEGFPGDNIKLGDVLISDRICDCSVYEHQKHAYVPRGIVMSASRFMLDLFKKKHFNQLEICLY